MNFQFGRISLQPETRLHRQPVFDVVMIGHTDKQAKLASLFANASMLKDMRDAGYSSQLNQLEKIKSEKIADPLYQLPIPLRSYHEFEQLFSIENPKNPDHRYQSRLAGTNTWLPDAVSDFFNADVMRIPRRLWIIPVDEAEQIASFLPMDVSKAPSVEDENAVSRALALPDIALIAMPDFERLHIAQSLKHIPKLRIANPTPTFLPMGTNSDDGVLERSIRIQEKPDNSEKFAEHLFLLLKPIARYRPDCKLLMHFPFDKKMDGEQPQLSKLAEQKIKGWAGDADERILRHLQLLYPFIQDAKGKLGSATALLAGKMLSVTTEKGSWRSIAGTDLPSTKKPFPLLSIKQISRLRDELGLGVLRQEMNQLQLDDERLVVPFVASEASTNSGELSRFMGWLMRSLENLGLNLVFESKDRVLKSELLLRDFFSRLYAMGALNGKKIEDAFSIKSYMDAEACIIEIAISPAIAIDKLILDFRLGHSGLEKLEVQGG